MRRERYIRGAGLPRTQSRFHFSTSSQHVGRPRVQRPYGYHHNQEPYSVGCINSRHANATGSSYARSRQPQRHPCYALVRNRTVFLFVSCVALFLATKLDFDNLPPVAEVPTYMKTATLHLVKILGVTTFTSLPIYST